MDRLGLSRQTGSAAAAFDPQTGSQAALTTRSGLSSKGSSPPVGLVRDGEEIVLDAITGTLRLLVDDQQLARRAAETPPFASRARRGYELL